MKRWVQVLIQLGGFILQAANIWTPFIPPDAKPYVAAGLATLQLAIGYKAAVYNPDGTPATEAWKPKG